MFRQPDSNLKTLMIFSRFDSWQMTGQALQGEGGQMRGGRGGGAPLAYSALLPPPSPPPSPTAKFCYEIISCVDAGQLELQVVPR